MTSSPVAKRAGFARRAPVAITDRLRGDPGGGPGRDAERARSARRRPPAGSLTFTLSNLGEQRGLLLDPGRWHVFSTSGIRCAAMRRPRDISAALVLTLLA